MIGSLKGILLEKMAPFVLLEVSGVGYELQVPMTTFYQLGDVGKEMSLCTHFSVSENSQQLFGFMSKKDRELFRLLVKVNGVGPKMAIGILSMESEDFIRCVMDENITALVKVPGVGKKTAERLVIEMRDKLKSWSYSADAVPAPIFDHNKSLNKQDVIAEAESALVALGYKAQEASRVVSKVANDSSVNSSETLIRAALKSMMPS